ncbi:GntR family transcriptional regulator [Xylanibacillus composti]|uniref:GntR family transcriptional regulator n=1 Tax=Xylanibacillus composti TaxID=1572762 RepID=A0A8J4H6T5_9BACL|nr:GntR family transcriptional regulator [Xylanibacillus composti]MDT9726628.1 GntR family transcriptional regulator [Xylanibacillus composti]GIQ70810.1 GntR family transcriptional regulator [Xylanibacillus composti]
MRSISLETVAYDQIKERIVRAEYMPGILLSENELAGELGMSRTPVRAAISLLEREGLVESFKGRGVLVKEISFRQFCQIHEVLVSMQVFVLDMAKTRELVFDLDALDSHLNRLDMARENNDYVSYYESSIMCIDTIIRAIGNEQMLQLLQLYKSKFICRMVTFRKQFPQHKPQWASVTNGKIYEALKRKDYEAAKQAVLENYRITQEQLSLSGII